MPSAPVVRPHYHDHDPGSATASCKAKHRLSSAARIQTKSSTSASRNCAEKCDEHAVLSGFVASWAEPAYCKHKTSLISPHSVAPKAQMNVSVFEPYNLGCHWSIVRGLPNALGILKIWWFQSDSSNIFQNPALASSRHEPSSSHLSNPRWPSDLEVESMKQTWLDSKSKTNSIGSHLRSSHMQTIAVGFPDKLLESRYSIAGTCHIARVVDTFHPQLHSFFLNIPNKLNHSAFFSLCTSSVANFASVLLFLFRV